MPGWITAIGAALPYIESVAKLALPVFKQRMSDKETGDQQTRQIEELQAAVTHNAEHVRALAQQLQTALLALEHAGAEVAASQRRLRVALWIVGLLAALSLLLATVALTR